MVNVLPESRSDGPQPIRQSPPLRDNREATKNKRSQRRAERVTTAYAVPSLVSYLFFTIGPLIAVFYLSFVSWHSLLDESHWVGFANFQRMWDDDEFWNAAQVTAVQLGLSIPILLVLSFMLGYYVSRNPPGAKVIRVLLFVPGLLSLAAQATMFYAVLSPNGLLNSTLDNIGLATWITPWLADPDTALLTLVVVGLWGGVGFTSVLFAANLATVDPALYEAAELDGAGQWRMMWRIAFPVCYGYFGVVTMLQFLWGLFGSAALILLLTKGGPTNTTTTLSYMVYSKAFLENNVGYSQTIGVALFFIGLIGIGFIRAIFRPRF